MASLAVVNRWEAADKVAGFIAEQWPEAVREGDDAWTFSGGHTLRVVDIPRLDIKGGHIRRRWLERRSLHYLVPPGVEALLEERADIVEQCWGRRV
jgi:nicotinate-nucleotide adenylyltransferase